MAEFLVGSGAELEAALQAAVSGDTIFLQSGDYDTLRIEDARYDGFVRLTAADPDAAPVITDRLVIRDSAGLRIDNLDITAGGLAPRNDYARVSVEDSARIRMFEMEITGHIPTAAEGADPGLDTNRRLDPIAGYGHDTGLAVTDSSDIVVSRTAFSDLRRAVELEDGSDLWLHELDIGAVREGVNLHDVDGVRILGSHFHDFRPWEIGNHSIDDHPDMIQYWGTGSSRGVHDVVIHGNLFDQRGADDPTQTLYGSLRSATDPDVSATDFRVTDNIVLNGHKLGLALHDVEGAVIAGNVLLPTSPVADDPLPIDTPAIALRDTTDAVVQANTFVPLSEAQPIELLGRSADPGAVRIGPDNVALSTDPDVAGFWRDHLIELLPEIARRAGAETIEGSAAADMLDAPDTGRPALLLGQGGDDLLSAGAGSTTLLGGAGADQFNIDLAGPGGATDTVVDLDFAAGDALRLFSGTPGHFSDVSPAGVGLFRARDNGHVRLEDAAGLARLIESGTLHAADGTEGLILSLSDAPDARQAVLAGLWLEDLGLEDLGPTAPSPVPAAPGATTPVPTPPLSAPADPTLTVLRGTGGDDTLRAPEGGALLLGGAGTDRLIEGTGSDVLVGGPGGDRFVFDLRRPDTGPERDRIVDLDFTEGDWLSLLGITPGIFTDATDPDNPLRITGQGASAHVNSVADLAELAESGAIRLEAGPNGLILTVPGIAPLHGLELEGYDWSDLGL